MNHSKWYAVGIIVGVLFAVVMTFIWVKRRKGKCEFDERQERSRGRAFKYGFFTALVYFMGYSIGGIINQGNWMHDPTWVFAGLCLSVGVFAVNAIWNDAYFSLNETPKSYIVLFIALAVTNLTGGIRGVLDEDSGDNSLNFCLGILLLCILIVLGVKRFRDKRVGEEE